MEIKTNTTFTGKFFNNRDFKCFVKHIEGDNNKLRELDAACNRLRNADFFSGYILRCGYTKKNEPYATLAVAKSSNDIIVNKLEIKRGESPYNVAYDAIIDFGKLGNTYRKFTGEYAQNNLTGRSIVYDYTVPVYNSIGKPYYGNIDKMLSAEPGLDFKI